MKRTKQCCGSQKDLHTVFLTLEDNTIFSYKCTNTYNKASEGSILWNDPSLDIKWGIDNPVLSEKDKTGNHFKDLDSLF